MAAEDEIVMVRKSQYERLRQHCECCPNFNEQVADLSDEHTIVTTRRRSSSKSPTKRKTLYGSESQEIIQLTCSSQQPEQRLPSQPSYTSCKNPKRAYTGGIQKRPRKDEAVEWFLRNTPKATEWRKRQNELKLDTVERYEQAVRAFTSCINFKVEREPYHGDRRPENELVDLAEKLALLTSDSLANARLQKSFATFQALILLSYCEVLRKRGIPYTTLDRIVQKIARRESDRKRLLGSVPWIHGIIVNLANHGWTVYRATELFFINALSLTYLANIHNNENSRYILEHLKTDEFVKHDYDDCLRPEYTFPGLIASLLDACDNAVNRISFGEICAALGYNSDHVPNSVKSIYKIHAASKSTFVTSLDLNFLVLEPSSFQSTEGPLTSASKSYSTITTPDPRCLHTDRSSQQSITIANAALDERATTTNCPPSAVDYVLDDSTERQTGAALFTDLHRLPPSHDFEMVTAPTCEVNSIEPASRVLATLLSFFGESKISECVLERARGPLLTWGENGEVEERQVNTVEVVQDKLMCDKAICSLHRLKAIRLEQSRSETRYFLLNSQALARIALHTDHTMWMMEAVKVVLYAFPIDRRLQPLYSFSIATSILPLLKRVLPYLEDVIIEKALPAAHVIEVCLSASYYSTLEWKNKVMATAKNIGTRFLVEAQLRERIDLRKKILSRISLCQWKSEVERLEITCVDQRSNGYYGDFVLFNTEVLIGRQQLQAAFDELDRYNPWQPENVSAIENFQICEMSFFRGKIHHFSGHFREARVWLKRVLHARRPEASMMCKAMAHLTAVCCELGETKLGIDYASTQLSDLRIYQSQESGSAKRLRLSLAYAYLMQGMWTIFTQPNTSGYVSLPRDVQQGFDKAHGLFEALARSYESASTLSRAGKTNRLSTLLGLAFIAHIKDDLPGARRWYDIALHAANDCNWTAGYIEAIIYWSKSVVLHSLGELEEARKLNGLAGSLYQCRSYFFVGCGTLWPEIIGNWVVQRGGERIIPQQGWEKTNPEQT